MKKSYDVVALGELLIDFIQYGRSESGHPLFEANPGGAPCNVLAMLAGMGKRCGFIGKVGQDPFGYQLKDAVEAVGIDSAGLVMDAHVPTTLALVHTLADGDRDFSFYRSPGADMMLEAGEVNRDMIADTGIFHFGTLSSTHEGVRHATREAIRIAKESGALISFDPNLRPPLWDDLEDAKNEIIYGMEQCDILKISDNEVEFLCGTDDYDRAAAQLQEQYDIPLICVTMGRDGSRAYYAGEKAEGAPFFQQQTVDTTGAGDTFCAGVLCQVLENGGLEGLGREKLSRILTFANAAASLITTRKGALSVMPKREEVEEFIRSRN